MPRPTPHYPPEFKRETVELYRVLATSREPLGVEGELVWRVDPLSVPSADPDHRAPAAGELARYDAVRLFVERARLRSPHFEIRAENAEAVTQICRRLEGMPLAVELAAARVRMLSLEQIAQRLGDSLKLLRGNSRTVPQRQRTLRATLEWSYDLLSPEEQVLLGRLSVFAGGWSLETAEAVVSGGEIKKGDVAELLSGLINKSLAETSMTADEALRYGMLEPVRHYARERLKASGEAEEIARLHAEYFLNLAEEAEPQVEGTRQRAWLERLEEEHDNLRVALSWSLERDDAELGLRMGSALGEFWYLREHFGEGVGWLEEALARSGRAPTAARARALYRVSWLSCLQGNLNRAQEASEEGLVLEGVEHFRTGGGDSVAAELRRTLGIAVSECGDFERAKELLEESLALSRVVKSGRGAAISLLCLGNVLRAQDDFGRATELYEEALTLCRESGDPVLLAQILSHLGYTLLLQGKLERAMALSEQAVGILRAQKHRSYLAYALSNLGWAALLRGNHEQAKASYKESLTLCRELGDPLPSRSHHPREVDGQSSRSVARVEDSHAGEVVAAESFEGLAFATEAGAEAERAARLFGIA